LTELSLNASTSKKENGSTSHGFDFSDFFFVVPSLANSSASEASKPSSTDSFITRMQCTAASSDAPISQFNKHLNKNLNINRMWLGAELGSFAWGLPFKPTIQKWTALRRHIGFSLQKPILLNGHWLVCWANFILGKSTFTLF